MSPRPDDSLTQLAGLLEGLARDIGSPLIEALRADCRLALTCCGAPVDRAGQLELGQRLFALHLALVDLSATTLPAIDDLRLRAVGEQLGEMAAALLCDSR